MTSRFRLRDIGWTAYAPSVVASVGHGAVLPVLVLRARELDAGLGLAAFMVALLGLGSLVGSLPAGAVVARVGERVALVGAGLVEAVVMTVLATTDSLLVMGAAVVVSGLAWTVFLIARQGYVIDASPPQHRARALAALGGSHRIGLFVGPLAGAGLIAWQGLPAVFAMAAATSVAAAGIVLASPDPTADRRTASRGAPRASVASVVVAHRRTLLTVGSAVVVIGASRSVRTSLLPLWGDAVGLSASQVSLVLALAAAVDIAFFYPGGWLMDTRGRTVVAVPVVASVALACLLLPLTDGVVGLAAVALLIAVGNGLGSGIVMTLGADTAPEPERAQYLGAWRLCGEVGSSGGPLLVGAVASLAPLAVASLVVGGLLAVGTVWTGWCTRTVDRRRR